MEVAVVENEQVVKSLSLSFWLPRVAGNGEWMGV